MADPLCIVRGGGDLGTGVVWRLTRCGFRVLVCELDDPLAVRRTVAVASALVDGEIDVGGMVARRADDLDRANGLLDAGIVAVLASPGLPDMSRDVVVDARMAKVNIDTRIDDAPVVVALGPGFDAGVDCHAVVETQRGHDLGRVIWRGSASPNTGVPGSIGGRDADRVLRAPGTGVITWTVRIGDHVTRGQDIGRVGGADVASPLDGVVRGLIRPGRTVGPGTKIGDIDPRAEADACHTISDKALAVGGGVVEAVMARRAGLA